MSNLSHVSVASLRGRVGAQEWQMRVDVAACYRLIALFGMNEAQLLAMACNTGLNLADPSFRE